MRALKNILPNGKRWSYFSNFIINKYHSHNKEEKKKEYGQITCYVSAKFVHYRTRYTSLSKCNDDNSSLPIFS